MKAGAPPGPCRLEKLSACSPFCFLSSKKSWSVLAKLSISNPSCLTSIFKLSISCLCCLSCWAWFESSSSSSGSSKASKKCQEEVAWEGSSEAGAPPESSNTREAPSLYCPLSYVAQDPKVARIGPCKLKEASRWDIEGAFQSCTSFPRFCIWRCRLLLQESKKCMLSADATQALLPC